VRVLEENSMPRTKNISKADDAVNPDYVRMYYEHQYDRINRHEEKTLTISNLVLTISALIITFGFSNRQSFGSILIMFLPAVIIILNSFAVLYINDRARYVSQHSKRAKKILEIYATELYSLDKENSAPYKKWSVGRRTIQNLMHYLFVFIGILLLVIFILEKIGVSIV
jgi:hypothetical protein